MSSIAILSDIHLGRADAHLQRFEQVCGSLQKGDTLYLLGDIMDLWVDRNLAVEEHVIPAYEDLWRRLKELRDRGIEIHYVPGNHDAILLEANVESTDLDDFPALKARINSMPELQQIRRFWPKLGTIACIHYPYHLFMVNNVPILLTHGHYHEWIWRLLNGEIHVPPNALHAVSRWVAAEAFSIRQPLRRLCRWASESTSWFSRSIFRHLRNPHRHMSETILPGMLEKMQDGEVPPHPGYRDEAITAEAMAFSLTNTVLREMDPIDWPQFSTTQVLVATFQRHMGKLAHIEGNGSTAEWLQDAIVNKEVLENTTHVDYPKVKALFDGFVAALQWHYHSALPDLLKAVILSLKKNKDLFTIHLPQLGGTKTEIKQPFDELLAFQHLVIGHRHLPEINKEARVYDNGAMLQQGGNEIATSLMITSQGEIIWNPNLR